MPSMGHVDLQGSKMNRKNATPSKKKPSGGVAGFTFVDQSADLRSIADKKIVDSDQRHLIRSHVMQKVRKDERLLGKKRPTGRDNTRKGSSHPASTPPSAITTPKINVSGSYILPNDLRWTKSVNYPSTETSVKDDHVAEIPHSPSQGRLDPFNTLPGGRELGQVVDGLIQYCFHKFIPMTFPIESATPREYNIWKLKVLQSQSANTATFFGMMATVAAHQAITNGRHKDLRPTPDHERPSDLLIDDDFALMKSCALQATHARIARNGWDGPTVEAIFSLIGAEQILGNFEEARLHLSALKKFFVDVKGFDPASPASDWIPLTDVKGAIGTMSRPLFRLPWNPEPIPQETIDKLYGWHSSEISTLGTSFSLVNELGPQLQTILQQATVLCRFCQFNAVRSQDLAATEYENFRRKTLELEYDVLSYIYPGSPTDTQQIPNNINTIEQIARLAVLGTTSSIMTKVLPSLGVGRALTHFQNLACQNFYTSSKRIPTGRKAHFIIWALMIFAQCAHKQPEERYFINSLAWYSQCTLVYTWDALEAICTSFLYVPAFQRRPWQEIWSKACHLQRAQSKPATALTSQPSPQIRTLPHHHGHDFNETRTQ